MFLSFCPLELEPLSPFVLSLFSICFFLPMQRVILLRTPETINFVAGPEFLCFILENGSPLYSVQKLLLFLSFFFTPLTVFCSTPSEAYSKEDPEEDLSLCFAETHLIRTQVHHLSFCCCLISYYLHSFLPPAKIHTTNQPLELVVNPHGFSQKVPVWQ